ncbi:uncharacterized protein LOC123658362 [Melitaea cinxia]|uniref:uncharacterized protein LOC123658362 n=1 Tax=Melitaea cinxia TaxID=113334 RepID=UPI001E274A90|nr:uncharacterized protein LOC123658362 [Melitaea cinxia]
MIAFALLAIVACASAAPHYHHDHHRHHHNNFHDNDDFSLDKFMEGSVFDTSSFWEQMRKEMIGLTAMIEDLRQRFPTGLMEEKIEGNEYKITISLTGFTDKEIVVKARKGLLIVEAVHKVDGEPGRSYLDLRTLPDVVNVNGSWTYENGLLKIVFPLEHKSEGEPAVTEAVVTQAPEHSHEVVETEQKGTNDQNADVGIVGGATNNGNSVSANEIPQGQNVEATTYAVDLKGEVELVPITNY